MVGTKIINKSNLKFNFFLILFPYNFIKLAIKKQGFYQFQFEHLSLLICLKLNEELRVIILEMGFKS